MLIGANKLDLFRFDEAEQHYKQALKDAALIKHHVLLGMAHHNLGLSYVNRNLLTLAEHHFKEALLIKEHEESVYGIHSMFELTHVLYKSNVVKEARKLYEKDFSVRKKQEKGNICRNLNLFMLCMMNRIHLRLNML